jgi:hypothetical protein
LEDPDRPCETVVASLACPAIVATCFLWVSIAASGSSPRRYSRADRERFPAERLGPALGETGMEDPPARMEWIEVAGNVTPGS